MKKVLFFGLSLFLTVSLFAQTFVDANAETRTVGSFHGVNVSNAFDVYLSQGNTEALAVSAESVEYRNMIKTEVKNGILHISLNAKSWKGFNGNKKLKAYISFKSLDKISISGACDVYIKEGLTSNDLNIDLSGASDLKGKVDVKNLDIDISGASDMTLTGGAGKLKLDASGASKFKGEEFAVDFCTIDASGASDVKITVNKEMTASASGASDIKYKGEGMIRDIRTSGAGGIKRL